MPDWLQNELVQRYLKRSALFWKFSREARFARWQKDVRNAAWRSLSWDNHIQFGITPAGRTAAERLGFSPTEVFAHPQLLQEKPELFDYYRLLACLSNKGLGQIKAALGIRRNNYASPEDFCLNLCVLINRFMCNALERTASANREALLRTMFAEAGSEWQGTWVNEIGELAAQEIEKILVNFAQANKLVDEGKTEAAADEGNVLILKSGASIRFASEPDVEFRSARKELVCVLEIKGSADKAGAQTRLGETKKSFTKAKLQNPRCVTIFMPSVLTPAVERQLRSERDIDKIFNLLEICNDPEARNRFLNEIGRISVFGGVKPAMVREEQVPASIAPKDFQTQECFIPFGTPVLARPFEATLRLPARRFDRAAANRFTTPASRPVVHPLAVFVKIVHFLLHGLRRDSGR